MTLGQLWTAVGVAFFGYLIALLYQTHHTDKRIDDLRSEINSRLASFERLMGERFSAVDKRFDDLTRWLQSEIRRLDDRLEKLEHPVVQR